MFSTQQTDLTVDVNS